MRGRLAALSVCMLLGCGSTADDPQRLTATGELMAADGRTPLAGQVVDRYQLSFVVAGEAGEVAIARQFAEDADGGPIVTDAGGRFRIASENLALSYQWESEELVCVDSCVAWETVCETVTEEVCLDTCTELECWDECTSECWEETFCDEYGCWTEVVCDEVCGEICEEVSYPCDCHLETYEVCFDECVETVEDCSWVTRTHTSAAAFEDVIATEATIWLRDDDGNEHSLLGQTLESGQQRDCDEDGCALQNLWIQRDRFVVPVDGSDR